LAHYYLSAGDHEQALVTARKAVSDKDGDHSVLPLALLAQVLWVTDHTDEARTTFDKLRALSSQADLAAPPLARLAPLAVACNAPTDWRAPASVKTDVGVRPALDTLGPFRWQPSPALPWSLPDASGKQRSLSDYRGKPVVVIFYLGNGCVHCTEQLSVFGPMAQAYQDAGIELIGISTDNVADLNLALASTKSTNGFAFPLVADPNKTIFKTYRAFDDFEKSALHGTFLIDAEGLVRWQDISFEPFMDAKFLLEEAKRLLAMKKIS
jgi:peroxiredoxin